MSIIPGIVFSRARWRPIRERNRTMDREVYLDNDHLVDYRVEERTTGLTISDLQLSASLSRNPTGSAIQSFFLDGGTSSFVSASLIESGTRTFVSGPTAVTVLTEISQSLTTNFTGSIVGNTTLEIGLTEDPVCSGQYVGTFAGADISTALSQSLSSSFSSSVSSSAATASLSSSTTASISGTLFATLAFTESIQGFTSSITESVLVPLVESDDRCFGIFEIIQSGSFLKASTPMTLRSVRFLP